MSDTGSAQRRAPPGPGGRWFEKAGGSPADKIPVFRDGMTDTARAWNDKFTSLASTACEITFVGVEVGKVDDLQGRRGTAAVLAILHAPGWNTTIGLSFDRVLIATAVESLFGGGGDEVEKAAEAPLSPVDLQIAEVVARQVADALTAGFAKRLASGFRLEGFQPKRDPGFLGKPNAAVVIGTMMLTALGAEVQLDVLVPLAAMMVFADELSQSIDSDQTYDDPRWTQRLEAEVGRAAMALSACIDLDPMTLGSIAALHEGQVIELPKGAGNKVRLLCEGDDLFRCELGQSTGFYTLRVDEVVGSVEEPLGPQL